MSARKFGLTAMVAMLLDIALTVTGAYAIPANGQSNTDDDTFTLHAFYSNDYEVLQLMWAQGARTTPARGPESVILALHLPTGQICQNQVPDLTIGSGQLKTRMPSQAILTCIKR